MTLPDAIGSCFERGDSCHRSFEDDIEDLFHPSQLVALYYDVVKKATEWPTRDHSIKTLAKFLGLSWRDTHPSGAALIEWFDRWIQTGDTAIKQHLASRARSAACCGGPCGGVS